MDILREIHHAQAFRLLAQDLAKMHSVERISDYLSELADEILQQTLKLVATKLLHKHVKNFHEKSKNFFENKNKLCKPSAYINFLRTIKKNWC